MSLHRFHCPIPLSSDLRLDLPENAARHACRVLRLRAGDDLVLFDGSGGEYACRIDAVGRDRVSVDVLEWTSLERESPLSLHLIQALQAGDKMDMTVQKAVELGVSQIVPLISRRSVVRLEDGRAERRVKHWRSVVSSACEQCGRNRLPDVLALKTLDQWLAEPAPAKVLRLILDPASTQALNDIDRPPPGSAVDILIGPEGDLTPEELQAAKLAGFVSIRLGPRILRTETAGLAAMAAIQCLWGDFREGADHV